MKTNTTGQFGRDTSLLSDIHATIPFNKNMATDKIQVKNSADTN